MDPLCRPPNSKCRINPSARRSAPLIFCWPPKQDKITAVDPREAIIPRWCLIQLVLYPVLSRLLWCDIEAVPTSHHPTPEVSLYYHLTATGVPPYRRSFDYDGDRRFMDRTPLVLFLLTDLPNLSIVPSRLCHNLSVGRPCSNELYCEMNTMRDTTRNGYVVMRLPPGGVVNCSERPFHLRSLGVRPHGRVG